MIGITYGEPDMSLRVDWCILNIPIVNPQTMTARERWRVTHPDTGVEVIFEVDRPRTLFGVQIVRDPLPGAKDMAEHMVYELARSVWEAAKRA